MSQPGSLGTDDNTFTSRTPGPLGHNDGGDPDLDMCYIGDTPGTMGLHDGSEMSLQRLANTGFAVTPPTRSKWFVFVTTYNGEPVILEYDPRHGGDRKDKLSYPVKHQDNFYRIGDIVWLAAHEEKWLYRLFPELGQPTDEHESVLVQFAWGYLLGPPPEYKIGYKIKSIQPSKRNGFGSVILQGVLFLDDKAIVELEKTLEFPRFEDFNMHWAMNRSASSMQFAVTMANFMASLGMSMAGGGVSALARGGARAVVALTLKEALKRTARRALLRKAWMTMRANMVKSTLKATLAFSKTYCMEIRKGRPLAELAQRARPDDPAFKRDIVLPAVAKASAAFASTLIAESLGGPLAKQMRSSGLEGMQKEIAERIIKSFATGIPDIFIKGIGDAVAKSADEPSKFDQELGKAMVSEIKNKFMNLVRLDIAKLGEAVIKG